MSELHGEARLNDVFKSVDCQGTALQFMDSHVYETSGDG